MLCDSNFGSRLTSLRAQRGMSQAQLAEAVGIAATQLHRYESGRVNPRPTTLAKIATALGTTPAWLATGDRSDLGGQPGHDFREMTLRLPSDVLQKLEEKAEANKQPLNTEVASRLEKSLAGAPSNMTVAVARLSMLLSLTDAEKITERLRVTIFATQVRTLGGLLLPLLGPDDTELVADINRMMNEASQVLHSPADIRAEAAKRMQAMRVNLERLHHVAGIDMSELDLEEFEAAHEQLSRSAAEALSRDASEME